MTGHVQAAKLTVSGLAAYAVAQIGSSLFFHVPLLILMPFMTNQLAIPAAIAGLVIFAPKIWVIFCDPMMGAWSDRARTRMGRRRPFVLLGGVATGALFAAVFSTPTPADPILASLVVGGLYLLGSTAYSAFSVPYLAMASEIAPRPDQVTLVTSWRMAFNFIGAFIAGLAPLLVQRLGQGRAGYQAMGLILALVCCVTVLVFILGTRKVPDLSGPPKAAPSLAEWVSIFRNRRFSILLQSYALQLLGIGVVQSAFAYYVIYQIGADLSGLSKLVLLLTLGSLCAQPLWVMMARRLGKLATYRIAVAVLMVCEGLYLVPGKGDIVLLYGVSLAVGVASAGYSLMAWSNMYDVIDADAAATGAHRAGAFTGVWSACEKLSIAMGVLSTGLLLQAFGFHSSASGFTPQSSTALMTVRLLPGAGPALLLGLSLLSLARLRSVTPAQTPAVA